MCSFSTSVNTSGPPVGAPWLELGHELRAVVDREGSEPERHRAASASQRTRHRGVDRLGTRLSSSQTPSVPIPRTGPATAHDQLHLIERACCAMVWEVYEVAVNAFRIRFTFVDRAPGRGWQGWARRQR